MQQITSILGVIAVWLALSVGAWWLHRLYVHRKQRRKLALANEAWMRVREAPEIFADIRAAGMAIHAADGQARTHALLSRVRDYGDFFDDVSALRAELSRALKRDDCGPLTEILNLRRDMWAAADVLLIDDPAVFGDAFSEPGAYEEFCRDAEDLLFLDAAPLKDDPIALRLSLADEDMQTFVSGVEGEIADERERERFPTWREIVAYPVGWVRAVPRGLVWFGRVTARAGRASGRLAAQVGRVALAVGAALWAVLREISPAVGRGFRSLSGLVSRRPRWRFPQGRGAGIGASLRNAAKRAPDYARAAGRTIASVRDHPAVERVAASMRRASDRFPDRISQGLNRAAEMAGDVRARAKAATFSAREHARDFEAGELGLHYEFLVKAHSLRQRYADMLRRAPELTDTGRQFIARLELEKRSERLRLGTAKLRRRARLELVRFLTLLIAALERLRDRLADAPPQPAQTTNLLTAPLHRLFLPPPSPREAGADFPGGLRAQARSWARGWGRSPRRMRDVTPEPDESAAQATEAKAPETEEKSEEPRQATSERKATEAKQHATSDDPTKQAVNRVRRLFGIRDRKRKRGPDAHRQNEAPERPRASAGAGRSNGERADTRADQPDDTETANSAKAQILPPLRGSRTGNYDETEAGAHARDSLRSRLSDVGDEDEPPSIPPEGADPHQGERRGWRRWFGL
jgi:hypothetical protein